MSANNYLLIKQYKKNKFSVADKDADTDNGRTIQFFPTLEEAIRFATDYTKNHIIEYGLKIKLLREKNNG